METSLKNGNNREMVVIRRNPDLCPVCGAVDRFITYKTTRYTGGKRRLRRCGECGQKIDERTKKLTNG